MSIQIKSAKVKKTPNINLLPEDEFEKSAFGKFVKWGLSTGRFIVVFTELIVILAFLSRFKLDRDITDIHESIEQKKAIVASATDLEKQIKGLQDYLGKTNEITKKQKPYTAFLTSFSRLIPPEIAIESFSLASNNLSLTLSTDNPTAISLLIYQLKNSPMFNLINVGGITRKSGSPIKFTLTAGLTPQAFTELNE